MDDQTQLFDPGWFGPPQKPVPYRRRPNALSPAERQFYRIQVTDLFLGTEGKQFEKGVADILHEAFEDFFDPEPWGGEGDWGCDGYIEGGRHVFACYGSEHKAYENDYARQKVAKDLNRAIEKWPMMVEWTFITNTKCGPKFMSKWEKLKAEHGPQSDTPLKMDLWRERDIIRIVLGLSEESLGFLYPGCESIRDFDLGDFVDTIGQFVAGTSWVPDAAKIDEVSQDKMDYNKIDEYYQEELVKGMPASPLIKRWFDSLPDPGYCDFVASRFKANYLVLKRDESSPEAILEALYVRVGGSQFRARGKARRMSTLSAVSYFFQSCDIFENVPEDWRKEVPS